MRWFVLTIGWVLALVACSSGGSGGGASGASKLGESCAKTADCAHDLKCVNQACVPDLPAGFCQAYDTLCPGDIVVVDCSTKCDQNPAAGDCWFYACGAEVKKCDNQEQGDKSIEACGAAHGWK